MNNKRRYVIATHAACNGHLSNRDLKAIARYQYQISEESEYDTLIPRNVEISLNNQILNIFVGLQEKFN